MTIGVSTIIATRDRPDFLRRTLSQLVSQSFQPSQIIIIDASENDETKKAIDEFKDSELNTIYVKTQKSGAASQRIVGLEHASEPFIWFLDDDIIMDEECSKKLWEGFADNNVGAVNAMISNQRYTKPGRITRFMYLLMHGKKSGTYAGKVIGPAWNLLPEDEPGLPDYVKCEWLNTTCTMYKRKAMPSPVFANFFRGYSMFEDLTLSVTIAKHHTLLNARTARIFHDSQPGTHKDNVIEMSCMALVNRYYVMTRVLKRYGLKYNVKLLLLESFGITTSLRTKQNWLNLPNVLRGKILGVKEINRMKSKYGV